MDQVIGLEGARVDVAMMRTPDGRSRLELMRFQRPAPVASSPTNAPANTLGLRRLMFAVDDIADVVDRLRAHGAELVGVKPSPSRSRRTLDGAGIQGKIALQR